MHLWPGATVTKGKSKGKQGSSFPMLRYSTAVNTHQKWALYSQVANVHKKPSFQSNVESKPLVTGKYLNWEVKNKQKMLQKLVFRTDGDINIVKMIPLSSPRQVCLLTALIIFSWDLKWLGEHQVVCSPGEPLVTRRHGTGRAFQTKRAKPFRSCRILLLCWNHWPHDCFLWSVHQKSTEGRFWRICL